MKKIGNLLLTLGLFFLAYAVFSRFYGQPGVAFKTVRSSSLISVGNAFLLLSLIATVREICKKS
jgi:hypothetical protein